MINRIILVGRATKDAELKYTPNGTASASLTLACERPFKNAQGEKESDFIPVVLWRQAAEFAAENVKKGKLQAVEGRLQVRNYENNEGKRVYITEVVADNIRVLEWADSGRSNNTGNNNNNASDPFGGEGVPMDISDDDLPF